jgi:hypothetical protein
MALNALVSSAMLWNNLPATIVRSRNHLVKILTVRGKRYAGKSKMNLVALVIHGLNAISAYVDDHSGSRLPSLHRATAVRMMGHALPRRTHAW